MLAYSLHRPIFLIFPFPRFSQRSMARFLAASSPLQQTISCIMVFCVLTCVFRRLPRISWKQTFRLHKKPLLAYFMDALRSSYLSCVPSESICRPSSENCRISNWKMHVFRSCAPRGPSATTLRSCPRSPPSSVPIFQHTFGSTLAGLPTPPDNVKKLFVKKSRVSIRPI